MEKPETAPIGSRIQRVWSNYCQLDLQHRAEIADQLGPVGRVLNIAANVQNFVVSGGQTTDSQSSDESPDEEGEVIDVEFEEM